MRFSDSTYYDIPKPIKRANGDSSPVNSDESLSDENTSQDDTVSSQLAKPLKSYTAKNYNSTNPFSIGNSHNKVNDNLSFKQINKTHQSDRSINKIRLSSQINLFYLTPQMTETVKLCMTRDIIQKILSTFHTTLKTLKTIFHFTKLNENW